MKNALIPLSIVIGFGLVAVSLYAVNSNSGQSGYGTQPGTTVGTNAAPTASPERTGDHAFVYGNPDAATTIVEFSDYECPFCARLHPTLERIVDESNGTINWEYRHLPLPSHRHAELAAITGECIGRELGNEAFWEYGDRVFANQRSVDETFLRETASAIGLDTSVLDACLADSSIQDQVRLDATTARALGGSGTPFNVIVYADGSTRAVPGALPYEHWQGLLAQ